jgi:hypothetical protein
VHEKGMGAGRSARPLADYLEAGAP